MLAPRLLVLEVCASRSNNLFPAYHSQASSYKHDLYLDLKLALMSSAAMYSPLSFMDVQESQLSQHRSHPPMNDTTHTTYPCQSIRGAIVTLTSLDRPRMALYTHSLPPVRVSVDAINQDAMTIWRLGFYIMQKCYHRLSQVCMHAFFHAMPWSDM